MPLPAEHTTAVFALGTTDMTYATIIGYVAAALSTASFAPQAWKIIRARQTKDISTGMYVLTVAGFGTWIVFGLLMRQWPLVLSNSICLLLSAFILLMKLLPRAKKDAVARLVVPD
jgi:MtN3 and saliva related transmembrane protein